MQTFTFNSFSETETENTAYNIAGQIKPGDIVALHGDLGAGKTAFTRGLVRFFTPDSRVSSPTFSLVNHYHYNKNNRNSFHIFHFDMYRINSEEDLLSIGFFDYLEPDNILIIEWFEKIQEFFDEQTIEIHIIKNTESSENSRKINFKRIK
jgi:tRNA threonylcarbamoyladenosine biosynthesis protein TsaE